MSANLPMLWNPGEKPGGHEAALAEEARLEAAWVAELAEAGWTPKSHAQFLKDVRLSEEAQRQCYFAELNARNAGRLYSKTYFGSFGFC